MSDRTDKVARLHNGTLTRLEAFRTHPRDTMDDLINRALDKADTLNRLHDNKGRFVKQP